MTTLEISVEGNNMYVESNLKGNNFIMVINKKKKSYVSYYLEIRFMESSVVIH